MKKGKLMKQLKKKYKKLGKKRSNSGPIIALIIVGGLVAMTVIGTLFGSAVSDDGDDDLEF